MQPFYDKDGITLYCGDCLQVLPTLEESSVNLCVDDPPYFKVKDEPWDRQWDKPDGFLAWIGQLCAQRQRVLTPNGSVYTFAAPRMAWRVTAEVARYFNVLNEVVWVKGDMNGNGQHSKMDKDTLRAFFPQTERIIFAEHHGAEGYAKGEAGYGLACDRLRGFLFEPIRAYLDGERRRAGLTQNQVNEICGTASMAGRHYFSQSQWCMPTPEHYATMQAGFNRLGASPNGDGEYLRRDYEYLRRDYEYLRRDYEDLRRPFNASPDVPYTDVWEFETVYPYPGKHPAEKPVALLEHIISASSRPGDVVLDCCAGHGTTAIAARNLGRRVILVEQSELWCRKIVQRLARSMDEVGQAAAMVPAGGVGDLPLFAEVAQ